MQLCKKLKLVQTYAGVCMFLNDQETATDLLHYEAIPQTIVSLILNTPKAPMTIGVQVIGGLVSRAFSK